MFTEAQKCLYEWKGRDQADPTRMTIRGKFDPLAVRRTLIVRTENRLDQLLNDYDGVEPDGQDAEGNTRWRRLPPDLLREMRAEGELVVVARAAFALSAQQATDAEVIELLYDFLAYLGKPVATDEPLPSSSPCAEPAG